MGDVPVEVTSRARRQAVTALDIPVKNVQVDIGRQSVTAEVRRDLLGLERERSALNRECALRGRDTIQRDTFDVRSPCRSDRLVEHHIVAVIDKATCDERCIID
jgi:hypothetical protein